jgi:hypothetical protein
LVKSELEQVFNPKWYRSALLDSPRRLSDHPAKPCEATAMDVGGWLRGLGLGQYEAVFRDNKIDVDVLADLTDGDLEKLGLPLGDRKRLLKAIAGIVGLQTATRKSEPMKPVIDDLPVILVSRLRAIGENGPDTKTATIRFDDSGVEFVVGIVRVRRRLRGHCQDFSPCSKAPGQPRVRWSCSPLDWPIEYWALASPHRAAAAEQ